MRNALCVAGFLLVTGCQHLNYRPPPPQRLGPPARELTRGDRVRLSARSTYVEGTLLNWDSVRVVLGISGTALTVALADVDSAWLRDGGATQAIFAFTGVLAGVAGGITAALAVCGLRDECERRGSGGIMGLVVIGSPFLGGYLGSRLGDSMAEWKVIYTRR